MSTSRAAPLHVETIVAAAIELADAVGLEALTMRRLSGQLGVTPMALYKHVAGREELIDAMLDHVIAAIPAPEPQQDWHRSVRARILAARDAWRAHPWARDALETRRVASPTALAHMDALAQAMRSGGLSADLTHHAMHALGTRMWGFARDVLPTPTPPTDPIERAAAVSSFVASYPAIAWMSGLDATPQPCEPDAEFCFALDLLLIGIQLLQVRGWSSQAGQHDAAPPLG